MIEGLKQGGVDIVIGTHRLAQPDVSFANLGLLIIDEEQRFGVEVKERLKALRATVDVLTMTATPIPRTLHMALLGVRDISNLETPPEDRLAVETRIGRWDEELIRHAIMRELNRGGQIYFVHNRINDIAAGRAASCSGSCPRRTWSSATARCPKGELEQRDARLHRPQVRHPAGDDDHRERPRHPQRQHDLHRRGRHLWPGRSAPACAAASAATSIGRTATCWSAKTSSSRRTPPSGSKAIEEFSDMGAGFAIAMRDLEIRGAGNILGTQQSGHIATVGYELYCELLEQAVRKLKHLPPQADGRCAHRSARRGYLPRNYVPDMRVKIDLYRRLSRVSTYEELADLAAEMLGPLWAASAAGRAASVACRASHRRGTAGESSRSSAKRPMRSAAIPTAKRSRSLPAATAAKCGSWTSGAPTCRWIGRLRNLSRVLEPIKALLRAN